MTQAFVCDAVRSPIGRFGGALSALRTDDLAAHPISALMARNSGVDWAALDDVIYGCANQAGEDNRNVARMASLIAGLPVTVPGAVAAALRFPGRQVLSFIGDGGMLMTGGELATAMQAGAALKLIVSNNRSYGTIRLYQERDYPRRISGTDLANPDFAAWAQSFGAEGIAIAREDEIEDAVERTLAAEGSVVLEVRSSLEAISAYTTLEKLRGGR